MKPEFLKLSAFGMVQINLSDEVREIVDQFEQGLITVTTFAVKLRVDHAIEIQSITMSDIVFVIDVATPFGDGIATFRYERQA